MTSLAFSLPSLANEVPIIAVHTRIGSDGGVEDPGLDPAESMLSGFFCPNTLADNSEDNETYHSHQWVVVAQSGKSNVQLFAFPATTPSVDETSGEFNVDSTKLPPFCHYLTAVLEFPANGRICDVGFYGDDGKSSLSASLDSGSGKEGSQSLGVLFQTELHLQLWLVKYDSVRWERVQSSDFLMESSRVNISCRTAVATSDRAGESPKGPLLMARSKCCDSKYVWTQNQSLTVTSQIRQARGRPGIRTR